MKNLIRTMASNLDVVGELLGFLWQRKLWWLVPMIIVLLVFGLLLAFASTSGVGPFIYALF
jgi:drug/metabolite transporter superfamily protein YnfA